MRTYLRSTTFGLLLLATGLVAAPAHAQQVAATVDEPRKYTLGGITVSGARSLDPNTLIGLSGLRIGDQINIPGEEIGKAIRRIWTQGLVADVSVSIARTEGDKIFLDFNLRERPACRSLLSQASAKGRVRT